MTLFWLCAGAAALYAGNRWMKKGVTAVLNRTRIPALVCGVILVFISGGHGIALAASAAVQQQSAFLLMALLTASVYYMIIAGAVISLIHPVCAQGVVWKREGLMIAMCLVCLIIAGRGTWREGHPDVVIKKNMGIIFLMIMLCEIVLMMTSSMKGYRKFRYERQSALLPALWLTSVGVVMMVCAGFLISAQAESFAGHYKMHPAVCGLIVGGAVGLIRIPELIEELKCGGRRLMSVLLGTASLMLSGGLGIACVIMPVTISYTIEMAAVFALILLVLSFVLGIPKKRLGRVQAVVILAVCGEMVAWLFMQLI